MKKLLSYRPLVANLYTDINDFTDQHPAWDVVYRLFLQMKRHISGRLDATTVLNTVRFSCICVLLEKHPEEDIEQNYLQPVSKMTGVTPHVCYSLVYVLLRMMKNPPRQVPLFLDELEYELDQYVTDGNSPFAIARQYIQNHPHELWDISLQPQPESVWSLPVSESWWLEMTGGFDEDAMRCMLDFWQTNNEKEIVLEKMKTRGADTDKTTRITAEIDEAKASGTTARLTRHYSLPSFCHGGIFDLYDACSNFFYKDGDPRKALTESRISECLTMPTLKTEAIEAFMNGVEQTLTDAALTDRRLAEALQAKAKLEETLARCAEESQRLLKENKKLASENRRLKTQTEHLNRKVSLLTESQKKLAAENRRRQEPQQPSADEAMKELIDTLTEKAIETGNEEHLRELMLCFHELGKPELTGPALARIKKRIKEMNAPGATTQNIFNEGASQINASNLQNPVFGRSL